MAAKRLPPMRRIGSRAARALFARIDEVFPVRCPKCEGEMRIITFITFITEATEGAR